MDWTPRTRVVFGPGTLDRLGELAVELGRQRAFLVTDPGIVAAGHCQRAEHALVSAGIEVRRYDAVQENPTSDDVERCRQSLGIWDADLFIGLGGGSSIDVAKGCNFVRAGGGRMEDYHGRGKARGEFLPLIAVPTTAGTGTEMQSFALIERADTHQKMACGDPRALPAIAVLDPVLTVTQPRHVTACTGLDALGHAVETAVTKTRNPVSTLFSTEAFRLIEASLSRALGTPDDLDARGSMLLGAAWAGLAIENSMLGAAHAMANPLTAHHDLAHGHAVALVLPAVIRFNATLPEAAAAYAGLARRTHLCAETTPDVEAAAAVARRVEELVDVAGLGRSLDALGVTAAGLQRLAAQAAEQWTAQHNPRPVTTDDFAELLEATRR